MKFKNQINIPFSTSLLLLLNFPADAEDWDEDEEEQAPSHAGTDAYVRHTVRLPGRYSFVAHISRFLTIHSKIDDFWIFRLFTTGIKIKYVNLSVFWKSLQRRKMSLSLSPFLLYMYNTALNCKYGRCNKVLFVSIWFCKRWGWDGVILINVFFQFILRELLIYDFVLLYL